VNKLAWGFRVIVMGGTIAALLAHNWIAALWAINTLVQHERAEYLRLRLEGWASR